MQKFLRVAFLLSRKVRFLRKHKKYFINIKLEYTASWSFSSQLIIKIIDDFFHTVTGRSYKMQWSVSVLSVQSYL